MLQFNDKSVFMYLRVLDYTVIDNYNMKDQNKTMMVKVQNVRSDKLFNGT